VLQLGQAGAGAASVGEVRGEPGLAVDLDEQLGQRHHREAGHDRLPFGQHGRVDHLGGQRAEVEGGRRCRGGPGLQVGEQDLEAVEVAAHLDVDGSQPFGEGPGHACELEDLGTLGRPGFGGDQVGGGVGVAPGALDPDLTGAEAALEGEQEAQLP
jgi:hypothetical protein